MSMDFKEMQRKKDEEERRRQKEADAKARRLVEKSIENSKRCTNIVKNDEKFDTNIPFRITYIEALDEEDGNYYFVGYSKIDGTAFGKYVGPSYYYHRGLVKAGQTLQEAVKEILVSTFNAPKDLEFSMNWSFNRTSSTNDMEIDVTLDLSKTIDIEGLKIESVMPRWILDS